MTTAREAEEDELERLMRENYRWWSCSVSLSHLKVGPVSLSWYRWFDGRARLEAFWMGRRRLFLLGGPLL